ncbi:hypothetical protein C8Q70DRAFT_1049743 [Cubamyces menziesii]|nr:hypothetical protein C8Q70DRAFT_1049743 [Cubamyces menziesii]
MSPPSEHPVFKDPLADVILRSADNVHFRLHKLVLYLASDFFGDMFSLPQPARVSTAASPSSDPPHSDSETVDGLPVIPVTESSAALENLFRLCYPMDDPPLQTIEQVRPTLEAALKYQMRSAVKTATDRLRSLASTAPLRVYAIAHKLSLADVAAVARNSVRDQEVQNTYVDELEEISVDTYRRLLHYCTPFTATPSTPTSVTDAMAVWAAFERVQPPERPERLETIVSPMFDPEGAEVVILTSDNFRFGASQDILALSSPVFAAELSQELSHRQPQRIPRIITVSVLAKDMLPLLEIYYPIPGPSFTLLSEIPSVYEAANKYQMSKAMWYLRGELDKHVHGTSTNPVALYFAACRLKMRRLAEDAARQTLRPERLLDGLEGADSFGVSAGCIWRLLEYHRQCKAAVHALFDNSAAIRNVDNVMWISEEWKRKLQESRCSLRYWIYGPCWLEGYLDAMGKEEWPSGATAASETVLGPKGALQNTCNLCQTPASVFLMISFSKYVQEVLEKREREVQLLWMDSTVLA